MDDRPAIPASEKTETGFTRLVLRRLIDCGTPTTAKKYDQIRRVHFFVGGYIAKNRMKIAAAAASAAQADSK
jgi:hypothetical protein